MEGGVPYTDMLAWWNTTHVDDVIVLLRVLIIQFRREASVAERLSFVNQGSRVRSRASPVFLNRGPVSVWHPKLSLFNPLVMNGLSHPYKFNESTFIFRDVRSNFSLHFSMEFLWADRIAPDGTPHFAASQLGLFCCLCAINRSPGVYGLNGIYDIYMLIHIPL